MDKKREAPTDHEAFLRLFTRFEGNLRVFVASLLPTWEGVDEVMQESSIVLWRKFAQFDQSAESGFLDWAFMIARYEVLKYRRRRATDRLRSSEEVFELLATSAEKPTLPAGRRVTSYLLQLDAFPSGNSPNRKRSIRGQITFAKPIVGVIAALRLLKESEAIFGNPDVGYPSPRAVEPRPEGDDRPGFDSVILAADQRTLILDLKVAPQKLDQLRVLVEAD